MGRSETWHVYECRVLNRRLGVTQTVSFACGTDAEATEAARDFFTRQDPSEDLAGFEIWKDRNRLLVHLTERPMDPEPAFENLKEA